MSKITTASMILFFTTLLLCGLANTQAAAALQSLQVGMQAPDSTLRGNNGKDTRLSQLKGEKLTAVVFWSTWSAKSEAVLARMQKLYDSYRGRGFVVIAVNADGLHITYQTTSGLKETVEKLKLSYPVLLDPGLTAFNDFGVIALPSTVIVDADRIVKYELSGYPLEGAEDMAGFITETIEGKKTTATDTTAHHPPPAAVRAFNMGRTLLKSRQTADNAEVWFKKALDADPDFLLPRISLARIYTQRRADALARAELEQVLQRQPANIMALCDLGLVALNEGKTGEAVTLLEKALKTSDAVSECYTYAALAHGRTGDMDKSMHLFEEAARINPRDPAVFEYQGKLFEEKSRIPEAAAAYRRALEKMLQAR